MYRYNTYSEAFNGASGSDWRVLANYSDERSYLSAGSVGRHVPIYVVLGNNNRGVGMTVKDAIELARALLLEAEFFHVLEAIQRYKK